MGLELLNSSDSLASASQSAGIIGLSHHAWPCELFNKVVCFLLVDFLKFLINSRLDLCWMHIFFSHFSGLSVYTVDNFFCYAEALQFN